MKDDKLKRLARSLSGESADIVPYLPYLLQDFYTLGSSPKEMENLLRYHTELDSTAKVLDLGCGKGAVSIHLAKAFGFEITGIDYMPEFIEEARQKAMEQGTEKLCTFTVGDANEVVESPRDYDCVIWGAVGPVLGDQSTTLPKLKSLLRTGGYLLWDDAYTDHPEAVRIHEEHPSFEAWMALFEAENMELCSYVTGGGEEGFQDELAQIVRRADELIKQHPEHKALLENYVQGQRNEYEDLDDALIGVTWLLKKLPTK